MGTRASFHWPRGVRRLVLVLPLLASFAAPAAAQEDTTRAGPARPDTAAADTLVADTVVTPRARALQRLRALPATPIQRDTADGDTLADPLPGDTAAPATGDTLPPDLLEPGAPPGGPPVTVDDTLVVFTDEETEAGPDADAVVTEDSVLALLRRLAGYETTEYAGDAAVFEAAGNQLELTGQSRIGRGESRLETDSLLVYDGDVGVVCGYGNPILSGEADPVESDEICFDIERELGMAQGARTQFQQGATWYVRGAENRVYFLTGGEKSALYGQHTEFTSCELDHPHYTFRAGSVKMVEDEVMVASNVTLRFEDVPVFWLPWMVQSMKQDRRSGVLMPEFGVNDIVRNSTGYNRHLSNIGFYWAMNDYMSTRATFEWYSGNWTALESALTYRWLRQFLNGNLTVKQYWRQQEGAPAGRELTLNTSNSWQPDERTRVQLNANYASSSDFVRRNSFDPRELNRSITSTASLGRTFDWGSLNIGADQRQQLSTGQVDLTLPSLSASLSPITLFRAGEGLELVWSGSGSTSRRIRDVADTIPSLRDQETRDARVSQSLSFGNLRLSQSASWNDQALGARLPIDPDSLGIPAENTETVDWSTSVGYQQQLWAGTTLNPSLSVSGNQIRNPVTDSLGEDGFVAAPNRLSAGASLQTTVYGFWPGFGNFSRIRHKISPSFRWAYSPKPESTAFQDTVFGAPNLRERNQLTLSFNQTFEAKVRGEEMDTLATDTEDSDAANGEPRRLPQSRTVTLLALNTGTAFEYDFVAAEEDGRGFQTRSITNSIRSELLDGLQLSMTHDLFREGEAPEDGLAPRTFDPYLTDLRASFSIDSSFWLFRLFGMSARPGPDDALPDTAADGVEDPDLAGMGAESEPDRGAGSSMVPNRGSPTRGARGTGSWNASLNYSLQRNRPGPNLRDQGNQTVQGTLSFRPTELWSVSWNTAYSFTDGEFANHVLTLSRDLHRWTANFDFVKAQNGNFAMQFRVQLRDNPDLKVDYDQRERREF